MPAAQRTLPALPDSRAPAHPSCLCHPLPGEQLSAPSSPSSSHKLCSSQPWVVGMLHRSSSSRQPLQRGGGCLQNGPQQIPALPTPA